MKISHGWDVPGRVKSRDQACNKAAQLLPLAQHMTAEARDAAATSCPKCQSRTLPDPVVYSVVASYTCAACGAEWSARLRNGRPDVRLYAMPAVARVADESISPLR
jgi:hypothetical protein